MIAKTLKTLVVGAIAACAIVALSRPGVAQEDEARRKPSPVNVAGTPTNIR